MAEGYNLPAVKPGEQLQQQRDGVSQRVTVAGDWVRQTDQSISENSMKREITADDESRKLVARETTVQAMDKTTVLGTASLLAGAVVHISEGGYSVGTSGNLTVSCSKDNSVSVGRNVKRDVGGKLDVAIKGDVTLNVGGALTEKIIGIRRSLAKAQELIAPVVKLGSEEVKVLTLLTDTLGVLNELALTCAAHMYPSVGASGQASQFTAASQKSVALKVKYSPLIA